MKLRPVIDVSHLPTFAFGPRSILWWATLGLIAIEGTVFFFAIVSCFYLQGAVRDWPPGSVAPPSLTLATINTAVLLVSLIPNQIVKKASEELKLVKMRRWMLVANAFALTFLVIRGFEFAQLNVRWDSNAYGSIVWVLLGLHTAHLLTDAFDTGVLTVMAYTIPVDGKRFVDVSENAFYWYFVVLAWIPIYAVIYLLPRF